MQLTKYRFSNAINAFFEMPTETAAELLPDHLQPLELRHQSSILAVTAFHFTESMVGDYHEVVLAVIVPPMVKAADVFPKSAYYPFVVGTSTSASREHAIERWHLPHYMADVHVDLVEKDGTVDVRVRDEDSPILDFRITAHKWSIVDQLYQCFMTDDSNRYRVDMHLHGRFTEHEDEQGRLTLHEHPMTELIFDQDVATHPFREMWMKDGMQVFEELETI
ncbi:MAG TPA: acetoacetate decarboxylase family protein [Candidatus Krumholzibacteria bacterium]|nr:acetoacetate decarboxylase family protein [Candidatus Krumholzibacteria bacterium]